ncbi:TolB family protein [Kitasatospora sp. NPDC101183]|uniref:TolB family protein n=1 Tax=Kitasatospora sp. NPDC101183 TaxID=3364100 RepID=UPI003801DF8F
MRNRFGTAAAIALMTTVSAVLLSACGPDNSDPVAAPTSGTTAAPGGSGGSGGSGGTGGGGTGKATPPGPTGQVVNGTSAANHLTISTGGTTVAMNGTTVDFGTAVRDLQWSPDGKRAVFVNGDGDLVTSNPDGGGKTVVAKHPAGETWSHPTWQRSGRDNLADTSPNATERFKNIVFASEKGGAVKLETIPAKSVGGTPEVLAPHNSEGGNENMPQPPQAGNGWPNAGGQRGEIAYANGPANEVFVYDTYIRPNTHSMGKGSQPAISPDGEQVVFVRSVDGHDHLFRRSTLDAKSEKDLTPKAATDYTEPVWSPDGKTLAVRTPDGIATLPSDGSAAPVQVSTVKGLPSFRP